MIACLLLSFYSYSLHLLDLTNQRQFFKEEVVYITTTKTSLIEELWRKWVAFELPEV